VYVCESVTAQCLYKYLTQACETKTNVCAGRVTLTTAFVAGTKVERNCKPELWLCVTVKQFATKAPLYVS